MKYDVNTERTDKAFRKKILTQERGPTRSGEALPPQFDWSVFPEAKSTPVVSAGIRLMLFAIISLVVIALLQTTRTSEPAETPPTPERNTEDASKFRATAATTATTRSHSENPGGLADLENKAENISEGSSSHKALLGLTSTATKHTSPEGVVRGTEKGKGISIRRDPVMNSEPAFDTGTGLVVVSGTEDIAMDHTGHEQDHAQEDNSDERMQSSPDRGTAETDKKSDSGPEQDGVVTDANLNYNEIDATGLFTDEAGRSTAYESKSGKESVFELKKLPTVGIATSLEPLTDYTTPTPELIVPVVRITPESQFEIRVFSSLNRGYRILSGNGRNDEVIDKINKSESASVNFGFGVHFGWNINRKWTLLTGISKRTTTINYQFPEQVIYDKAREIINSSGDVENSTEFEIETSGGLSSVKTIYAWRLAQDGLKHGDRLDFTFEFGREYHSVVIPLHVQYNIVHSAFKFGVLAGAQYARIYQTGVIPGRPNVRIRPDQHPVPPRGRDFFTKNTLVVSTTGRELNKNIFEATLGLHFAYQFTELFGVYLQPSYSHGLNNIYASDNFSTIPTNKQIDAGIVLTF